MAKRYWTNALDAAYTNMYGVKRVNVYVSMTKLNSASTSSPNCSPDGTCRAVYSIIAWHILRPCARRMRMIVTRTFVPVEPNACSDFGAPFPLPLPLPLSAVSLRGG